MGDTCTCSVCGACYDGSTCDICCTRTNACNLRCTSTSTRNIRGACYDGGTCDIRGTSTCNICGASYDGSVDACAGDICGSSNNLRRTSSASDIRSTNNLCCPGTPRDVRSANDLCCSSHDCPNLCCS